MSHHYEETREATKAELKAELAEAKAAGAPTEGSSEPHEHILQFFGYLHLPPALQAVSMPFCHLAKDIVITVPRNPERTVALRKLLEAKDAAVRAVLAKG